MKRTIFGKEVVKLKWRDENYKKIVGGTQISEFRNLGTFLHKVSCKCGSNLLTYLLTPQSRVLLEKSTGFQLVMKFSTFYGTLRFITPFTSASQLSLSWATSIQSKPPHPTSLRSILILSSHLWLGLPSGLFPSGFLTKTLYKPLLYTCYMPRPSHSSQFTTRTILGEQYRSLNASLCNFLHSHYLVPLRPKYSPQHPFLKHPPNIRSSLNVSNQVSHPYTTTVKITVLYIIIFIFLDSKLEDKWFCTKW